MRNQLTLLAFLVIPSIAFSQSGTWIFTSFDTITFEEIYPYLEVGNNPQNIWQIGKPNKLFFDSADASPNAIVTDTINNYPINNYSYFDLKLSQANFPGYMGLNVFLEIRHQYDTDSLIDGGFITVSYDSGNTWVNIMEDMEPTWCQLPWYNPFNLYNNYSDSLANGEWGFSGKSDGWVTTQFGWAICPVKSNINFDPYADTMLVRFNFVSDSIDNNKEGWMIDNIILYAIELGGSVEQLERPSFKLYPNPAHQTASIEFEGYHNNIQVEMYTSQGQLILQQHYPTSSNISVNTQDLIQGIYFLKISSEGKSIGLQKVVIEH